jgi:hypothetical protein
MASNPDVKVSAIPLGPIDGLPMWLDSEPRRAALLFIAKHKKAETGFIVRTLAQYGVQRFTMIAMEREGVLTRNTKTVSTPLSQVKKVDGEAPAEADDTSVRVETNIIPEDEAWSITEAGARMAEKLRQAITQ